MIDNDNLRTASLYINNQLLSRGLLRDGQSIDFADPEMGDGGLQATMGRVMSVVNDLILRRDRDAEHRDALSTTLRGLRAESQRQTTELARESDKLQDTQRRLDGAEATERAVRIQLKTAESHIHKLKEEMVRLKALVAQTRAACANEVRKRDRQIDSLKKAVTDAGRVRGGGKSRDVMTISIVGEVGAGMAEDGSVGTGVPAGATEAEGYSLRMETNEFLTELARGLSEENEGLIALVRRTVNGLREMSGLDRNGESINGHESHNGNFSVQPPQKTAEELATELEAIMEHLRTILTNPSFVPIEEVEVREEAINRLRAGLETMEERWRDAVQLIDGWRRRMVSSGRSIDVEDLKMGLRLSPVRVRNVDETSHAVPLRLPCVKEEDEEEEEEDADEGLYEQEHEQAQERRSPSPAESLHLVPAPGYAAEDNDEDSDSYSSIFQDDVELDDLDVEEPNVQILQASTTLSRDSSPLPEPPQLSPLKDSYSSGNKRSGNNPPARKGPGDFTTIVEENTWDLIAAEQGEEEPPAPPQSQSQVTRPKSPKHRPAKLCLQKLDQQQSRPTSADSAYDSPLFGKSGERPSLSPPSRKLFSKPSAPAPTPAPAPAPAPAQQKRTVPRSKPEPEPSQPRRVTRASARKSQEAPASPSSGLPQSKTRSSHKRTSSDPNPPTPGRTATPTRSAASKSTSSPKTRLEAVTSTAVASAATALATVTASPTKPQQSPQRPTNRSPVRKEAVAPTPSSSRLPRRNNPPPQQSPLTMATIAAKLAASEREADAARVRAKLRALRRGGRATTSAAATSTAFPANGDKIPEAVSEDSVQPEQPSQLQTLQEEDVDPVKKDLDPPPPLSGSTSLTRSQKQRQREEQGQGQTRPRSRGKSLSAKIADADANEIDELALGNTSANPNISPSRSRRFAVANNDNKDKDKDTNPAPAVAAAGTPKAGASGGDLNEAMSKAKRRRDRRSSKVASVRRSTLSPWELESLIQGNVAVSPGAVESPAR